MRARLGILFVPAPPPALNLKQDKRFAMAANSTVMYSGLDPCAKSSSKVLAPPGGKSSIGFGPEEDLAPSAPAEPNPEPRSLFYCIHVMHKIFIFPGLRLKKRHLSKLCLKQRSPKRLRQNSLRSLPLRKRRKLKRKNTQKRWDHRGRW